MAGRNTDRTPGRTFFLVLLIPVVLLGSLFLAWRFLAAVDFLYPTLYDAMAIDEHIAEFAPQNRYRRNFESTTRDEHRRLFSEIATSIRNDGKGLGAIEYRDASGRVLGVMLRPPEIVHLTDVARLVDLLERAGVIALLAIVLLVVAMRRKGTVLPSPFRLAIGSVAGVIVAALVVVALGATEVFYALHRWVFPEGHQWFFYYEESLMSTVMKAPDLFGYIAVILVAIALTLAALLLTLTHRILARGRP